MAAVEEDQRIAELRRLGASEPLVRLASGDCVHPTFRDSCLGAPYYVYHGAGTPDGPPLVALWDFNDTVVGMWARADGPEFINFSIETNGEYRPLARTEQGFWATQFDFFYESEVALEELREAAAAVGFRFLDRYLASRQAAESRLGAFEAHRLWLRELVAYIDREVLDAERDAHLTVAAIKTISKINTLPATPAGEQKRSAREASGWRRRRSTTRGRSAATQC